MPVNFQTGKVTTSKRMQEVFDMLQKQSNGKYQKKVFDFEHCILRDTKDFIFHSEHPICIEISGVDGRKRNRTVTIFVHGYKKHSLTNEFYSYLPFTIQYVPDNDIHLAIENLIRNAYKFHFDDRIDHYTLGWDANYMPTNKNRGQLYIKAVGGCDVDEYITLTANNINPFNCQERSLYYLRKNAEFLCKNKKGES